MAGAEDVREGGKGYQLTGRSQMPIERWRRWVQVVQHHTDRGC